MRSWPIFLLAGTIGCGGPDHVQAVRDKAGRTRAEVTWVGGKKEGAVRFFHPDGHLQTEGQYSGDSRHGAWTSISPAGDTLSVVTYRFGKKDGLQAYWAPNGQLLRLERFRDGEPDGVLYRFFSDGTPRQACRYENGVLHGEFLEWFKADSTSIGLTIGHYENGVRTGLWTWFYGNGRPQRQGRYRKGAPVGTWRRWGPGGGPPTLVHNAME